MAQIREIRKRIKAVGNIKRITHTMQMIATSKFVRAQQRAVATKPYTEGVFELVREIAATAGSINHPLIDGNPDATTELTLVLTSDRGFCGPYNGTILRLALGHLRVNASAGPREIELVGKKGASALRFNGIEVSEHYTQFGDKPEYEDVERLAQYYMDRFVEGQLSKVDVVYMRYISAGKQVPEIMQLLPLKPLASDESDGVAAQVDYEFSPPAGELLGSLLPAAVKATLFQAFNDAVVSEHVSRMVAMKAATDNAGKMGKSLKRKFNRARQAQITTELTEIIGGAAALE